MSRLQTAMVALLKKDGWQFKIQDETHIALGFKGENGVYNGWFILDEDRLALYFAIPFFIPENRRDELCEFITRANYGLYVGNFEMDLNDGELRFKTSLPWLEKELPSDEMLNTLIGVNVRTIDRYFPGISAVVYADADPEAAVKRIETGPSQPGPAQS